MSISPIDIIFNGVDNVSRTINQISGTMNRVAGGFTKAGNMLTAGVTMPLVGAGVASIKMANDLNESMGLVQTLMPRSIDRVHELKSGVQELAIDVGKGTGDIASGLYEVVSAFGDTDDAMGQLTITAKAAKAGNATTAESLSLLSAVTKGYNDTSLEAMQTTADLAFLTVKEGQTSFGALASSIGKVVPMTSALNVSQRELFASYATLTGVTGTASEVSTQLAAVLSAALKPTKAMEKTVKDMGFASASTMIKEKGLVESLDLLMKRTGGSTDAMAKLLGSKEALTAALALTGAQAEKFSETYAKMGTTAGALEDAFEAQTQGINKTGFALEQSKQRIAVSMQKIGDALLPVVDKVLAAVTPMLEAITDMAPEVAASAVAFGGLLVVLGPILSTIGTAISLITSLAGAITGAGGVVALLSNPVGWVVLAIGALIAVVIALWDELEPLRNAVMDLADSLWEQLKPIVDTVIDVFGVLWGVIKKLFIILQPFMVLWLKLYKWMAAPFVWVLVKAFQSLGETLKDVLSDIDWMLGKIIQLGSAVGKFFGITIKGSADLKSEIASGPGDFPIGASIGGIPQGVGPREAPYPLMGQGAGSEQKVKIEFGNLPENATVVTEGDNMELKESFGPMRAGYR